MLRGPDSEAEISCGDGGCRVVERVSRELLCWPYIDEEGDVPDDVGVVIGKSIAEL